MFSPRPRWRGWPSSFCADVHAATAVSVARAAGPQAHWTIALADDQHIEYENRDGLLWRTEYRAGRVLARDCYAIPAAAAPRMELHPAMHPVEASLLLTRNGDGAQAIAGYVLRIDAWIGRDLLRGPLRRRQPPAEKKD